MKQYLRIPNTSTYVVAIALVTDRAGTLTFLLEIGAIAAEETGLVRQIRQSLQTAYARISDIPKEQMDWEIYAVIGEIMTALESPDYQGYLSFRLRETQSGDDLIDALAVVHGAHYYRQRPWEAGVDEHAAAALRRMLDTLVVPFRSKTTRLSASTTPLLSQTTGGE